MKKIVCCAIMLYAYHPPLCARMSASRQDIKQAWEERQAKRNKAQSNNTAQPSPANSMPPIIERRIISSFEDNPEFRKQVKILLCKFAGDKTIDLQPLEDVIIKEHDQRTWDALPWYSQFKHNHPILTECARFAVYSAAGALAYHYLNAALNGVSNCIDPNERGPLFNTDTSSSASGSSSSGSTSSSTASSAAASPAASTTSSGFVHVPDQGD